MNEKFSSASDPFPNLEVDLEMDQMHNVPDDEE